MIEIEALCRGAVPEASSSLAGEEIVVMPAPPATKSATKLSSTTALDLKLLHPGWIAIK